MPLWLAPAPLILASKSAARRALLLDAGLPVEVDPANIDERAAEGVSIRDPADAAALLALAKAQAVAARRPGRLVLGADRTLALETERFSKPKSREAARAQLQRLRGRMHELHSALAIVRDGRAVFTHRGIARLTMRNFSDSFLDAYLDAAGQAVTESVGAYQLEKIGIQLFERVEGDHATILGLPLLPLLSWLRQQAIMAQ
jgi:septum formation protein